MNDLKGLAHSTSKLNQALNDWISMTGSISSAYRLDCRTKCPFIFLGQEGYPPWNPAYRYGDYIKWHEKEYCKKYVEESEYIFRFIANIVTGGVI